MKHLTDENIENIARKCGYYYIENRAFIDGYKLCQNSWQLKPIEELDTEYRGAIILYNNKKMELHIIGYIDEYITIQKYYTHYFIPPALKIN